MSDHLKVNTTRRYLPGQDTEELPAATWIHIEDVSEDVVTISLCDGDDDNPELGRDLGTEIDITPGTALQLAHQLEIAARRRLQGYIW